MALAPKRRLATAGGGSKCRADMAVRPEVVARGVGTMCGAAIERGGGESARERCWGGVGGCAGRGAVLNTGIMAHPDVCVMGGGRAGLAAAKAGRRGVLRVSVAGGNHPPI